MLGVDHTDVNACGDCGVEFARFWTESVPTFFTETIPQAFQTAWDAVAEWIDTCVKPFFESCQEWFTENAEWLWPVAIGFVGLGALIVGIVLPLVLCQSTNPKEPDPKSPENTPPPSPRKKEREQSTTPPPPLAPLTSPSANRTHQEPITKRTDDHQGPPSPPPFPKVTRTPPPPKIRPR